uniref:Septin-type G domain-containing protein n=1 Tax=Salarias fasciatus TaxID=181472 RepID=A0A672HVD0_SALFA
VDHNKEYVGFATLPNQVHRKSVKKGFDFTLMVAGESGLGKSTLVNSLFLTDLYKDRKLLNAEERITQTVEITKHTVDIEEKGVKLKLTIVDTPGFGDAVNNTECWKPVADYIDQQFEQYFRDESGLNRKNIQDNRVHCCLYFISPFGHGLRPLDVEFMKALHEKVNIVPILAKADTLTPMEVKKKKIKIREEIEQYGIKIYQFPDCDSDEDEDFKQQDYELKESIPFAVIGSNTVVEAKGKRVRGRLYPWGIVEVENSAHCDFVKLRNMLVRTHMQDLKDVTRECHYENYRAHCIQSMTRMVVKERNRKYDHTPQRAGRAHTREAVVLGEDTSRSVCCNSLKLLSNRRFSAANSPGRAAQTSPSPWCPACRRARRKSSSERKTRRYGTPSANWTRISRTITATSRSLSSTSPQSLSPAQRLSYVG